MFGIDPRMAGHAAHRTMRQHPETMRRADLRSIISDLADRVASPLLLEDARQRTVAYSPQYQAVDELRKEAILTGSLSTWLSSVTNSGLTAASVPASAATATVASGQSSSPATNAAAARAINLSLPSIDS